MRGRHAGSRRGSIGRSGPRRTPWPLRLGAYTRADPRLRLPSRGNPANPIGPMHPAALAFPFLLASGLAAQWSNTPTANLPVGDGIGNQAVPRIAATSDGGCYAAWFDQRNGTYAVYVQRLDGHGVEQFAHGGLLVSGNPQSTSLVGWDMITDRDDHCVLTFTDTRAGTDLDVYAYRIAPNGTFVWGANGVVLSSNGDSESNPTVVEASDGDFVFFWPNFTQRTIQMQRLDRLGAPRFPGDGLATLGDTGVAPAYVHAVPADAGNVIAVWVRGLAFSAAKHLHMQKWDAAGTPLWNGGTRLPVFDAASVPIAHEPRLVADDSGGAVVGWHYSGAGGQFFARVQHVASNGTELFPHNGVDLSTNGNSRFDPSLVWLPATQDILAVYNERNLAQSSWGITAQKVTAGGALAFGSSGLTVLPIGATERQVPNAVPSVGGLLAFVNERLPAPNTYQVLGLQVDATGIVAAPVAVSTIASQKIRLVATATNSGTGIAAWSDTFIDSGDILVQNFHPDGSLGDQLATATTYGCGGNPAGSLTTSGRPAIGVTMALRVDNPLGTQAPGALAVLAVAFAPHAAFPCGQLVPGYGMSAPGANGELLLDLGTVGLTLLAGPWAGVGQPVGFTLTMPPAPYLYGLPLYAQGLLLDLQPAATVPIGLTTGVRLVVGA